MADQPEKTPTRSAADKERSRQQSRPVSGGGRGSGADTQQKSPTKPGNRPGGGTGPKSGAQKQGAKPTGAQQRAAQQRAGQGGGGKGGRGGTGGGGGNGRGRNLPPPRSAAPFIWGAVALVLVIILVVVLVAVSGNKSNPTSTVSNTPDPAPASLVHTVTSIPTSVYDQVGVTSPATAVNPPTAVHNKSPLTFNGKPGVFYYGAEYCPYCAAERWSLVTSLARFGTFSNLKLTQSSSTDVYPNTHTFSFRSASLTSPYVTLKAVEHQDRAGNVLQKLDKTGLNLVNTLSAQGGYPFIDFGNKYVVTAASFNPQILSGQTWQQIAQGLHDPTNPQTQAILTGSNYFSASICASTGGQPSSVCQSKGVKAAAKAMGVKY
jgi:hypothetical protein